MNWIKEKKTFLIVDLSLFKKIVFFLEINSTRLNQRGNQKPDSQCREHTCQPSIVDPVEHGCNRQQPDRHQQQLEQHHPQRAKHPSCDGQLQQIQINSSRVLWRNSLLSGFCFPKRHNHFLFPLSLSIFMCSTRQSKTT